MLNILDESSDDDEDDEDDDDDNEDKDDNDDNVDDDGVDYSDMPGLQENYEPIVVQDTYEYNFYSQMRN